MSRVTKLDVQIAVAESRLEALREHKKKIDAFKLTEEELKLLDGIERCFSSSHHEFETDGVKFEYDLLIENKEPFVDPRCAVFMQNAALNRLLVIGAHNISEKHFRKLPQVKAKLAERKNEIKDYTRRVKSIAKKHGIDEDVVWELLLD